MASARCFDIWAPRLIPALAHIVTRFLMGILLSSDESWSDVHSSPAKILLSLSKIRAPFFFSWECVWDDRFLALTKRWTDMDWPPVRSCTIPDCDWCNFLLNVFVSTCSSALDNGVFIGLLRISLIVSLAGVLSAGYAAIGCTSHAGAGSWIREGLAKSLLRDGTGAWWIKWITVVALVACHNQFPQSIGYLQVWSSNVNETSPSPACGAWHVCC